MANKRDKFKQPDLEKGIGPIEDVFSDSMSIFDDFKEDRELLDSVDSELINLAGSEVSIYLYNGLKDSYTLSGEGFYDDLYDEDRIKLLSPMPKVMMCQFEPTPIEEGLGEFGLELENEKVFTFNKTDVENEVGRLLRPGDVIKPAFVNAFYTVHEVQEASFESYGVYHLEVTAKFWRDSAYIYKLRQPR
jgi:hypothetical protein